MKIISFANQKGGVAKTTTALNIGYGLADKGYKVLLVDLDSQANLTYAMGIGDDELETSKTVFAMMRDGVPARRVVLEISPNIDLIPSNISLATADLTLSGRESREFLLNDTLKELDKEYDFILIDCPPALGLLTINAFVVSEKVYITTAPEQFSVRGLEELSNTIERMRTRLNKDLTIGGVIITMYDKRATLSNRFIELLESNYGDTIINPPVRKCIDLQYAQAHKQSIFAYKANSNGAEDYQKIVEGFIKREGK